MKFQRRIAEPVTQLADLRVIVIIQMLLGAENLDQGNARVPDPVEPDGREAVPDKKVSGERVKHPVLMIAHRRAETEPRQRWRGLEGNKSRLKGRLPADSRPHKTQS